MKIESFPASLTRGPTALNLQLDTNMVAWHVDVSVEFEVVRPNGLRVALLVQARHLDVEPV